MVDIKKKLIDLYRLLNLEFYSGTLPPITIKISFADRQVGWRLRYLDNKQYCIVVNWKLLDCTEDDLYINMLHQMVHIHNNINGIIDTSRGYQYHNIKWGKEVEKVGVITMHDNKGYHAIKLEKGTRDLIHVLFDYDNYRKAITLQEGFVENMVAFKCPRCNRIIQASPANKVVCGYCFCDYIRMI